MPVPSRILDVFLEPCWAPWSDPGGAWLRLGGLFEGPGRVQIWPGGGGGSKDAKWTPRGSKRFQNEVLAPKWLQDAFGTSFWRIWEGLGPALSYWPMLTEPHVCRDLLSKIFGIVHFLLVMVGSSSKDSP